MAAIRRRSSFNQPLQVPSSVATFLNLNPDEPLKRRKITELLYRHIKNNGLIDRIDRRLMNVTPEIRTLFLMREGEELRFENFQHYISRIYRHHGITTNINQTNDFIYEGTNNNLNQETVITRPIKVSRRIPLIGFNQPTKVPLSLATFLNLDPSELIPRTQIVVLLYAYIKNNGLIDRIDRRLFTPTPEIRTLFLMREGEELRFENFRHYVSRVYKHQMSLDINNDTDEDTVQNIVQNPVRNLTSGSGNHICAISKKLLNCKNQYTDDENEYDDDYYKDIENEHFESETEDDYDLNF